MLKFKFVYTVVISTLLVGCSFGTPADGQLVETVQELNHIETDYREAQETLFQYEVQEQRLFNETMDLTKNQREELSAKVTELKKLLGQRLAFLEKEELSIQHAKDSAIELDELLADAEGNDKKMIEQLKSVVNERYELHAAFVSEYKELATLQRELYEMLIDNRTVMTRLNEQVNKVNTQNEKVQLAISTFNEGTMELNAITEDIIAK